MTHVYESQKVHGHLHSKNVLLDDNMNVFVSDLGLQKFKKYAGIVLSYTNKTKWSSPEALTEKTSTAMSAGESDDVFSYGTILWELFSEQVPFEDYSMAQVKQTIAVDKYRLTISEAISEEIV
jgi:serine/threonine protein kinase